MMLWLIFAAIIIVVLAMLVFPLLRQQKAPIARIDYDIVVYRDQLIEVDRDIERSLLTSEQAEAAKVEIYRRMLIAEDAELELASKDPKKSVSLRSRLVLTFVILILIPLGTFLVYSYLGRPELPAKPYAARQNDPEFSMARDADQLAAQLEKKPDAAGYKQLADSYFMIRQYDKATEAYQKIIDINGGNATVWSELGESLTMGHDGLVVPQAHAAFTKALKFDRKDARARFYLGLSETQIDEPRRAVAIWKDLEKDSPLDAPWLAMLKEHIASFSKEAGFDPSSVKPEPPSTKSPHDINMKSSLETVPSIAPTTVDPDAAAAVLAMKPDDQQAMIHKMVDRLAAKMKDNPDDLDGWQRLARAYQVLGENDKAKEASSKASALELKSLRSAPAGADPAAAAAVMALKPDDQQVMIHKMVDRLAGKMKDNPGDLEGWQRLGHAYRVLGENDKAQEAENKAAALQGK